MRKCQKEPFRSILLQRDPGGRNPFAALLSRTIQPFHSLVLPVWSISSQGSKRLYVFGSFEPGRYWEMDSLAFYLSIAWFRRHWLGVTFVPNDMGHKSNTAFEGFFKLTKVVKAHWVWQEVLAVWAGRFL